jgi:predicted  nucleic acid-binding Zn-ribbon protein
VKETIRTLIALQKLDNQINQWHRLVADGPDKLAKMRENLTAMEEELANLKASVAQNSQRRRELEAESTDLVSKKSTNQSRQLKAKNNDEYRAVLKEAENITGQIAVRDDELLALMEEGDKLEAQLPELEKATLKEAKLFDEQAKALKKTIAESQTLEEQALVSRTKLTESLPKDALGRYLIVSKNRDGQAMAPVSGGLCQVCHLSVPPQLFNDLQRNDRLLSCPNCARIIYWPDHPDLKPDTPADPTLEAHG